jgi:hypothetical protein
MAGEARADIFSLRVEAHGGGGGGAGLGGAFLEDEANQGFFERARGGAYGGLIGLEVLFVEGWVQHHQYRNGDGLLGTWTQFMVGLDLDFEPRAAGPRDKKGKPTGEEGKQTGFIEMGLGVGFGVSTDEQVDPPLDSSEVTHRAFLVEGHFSAGIVVGKVIGIGLTIPVSGGYFFASGFANDEGNQYFGVQGAALLMVRGKLKIK